ncbi:STAS domain-containing protein [Paenisporosarcina indica]|uniref:STAS domain-containing protein n=1 Tax=Paenisporosarcina indica TaxID=650093 RepID=UPI00094FB25E|nr:STAS domain-containing protein [Paenisporosarcina indica]
MHQNRDLYDYLYKRTRQLTNDWYDSIDKTTVTGVYASNDPDVITRLKEQNFSFHVHLIQIFKESEESFFDSFEEWVNEIASDSGHQSTPVHTILNEFLNVQVQYIHMIEEFAKIQNRNITNEAAYSWIHVILKVFGKVMIRFVEVHEKIATQRLISQQEIINELSAPVIKLKPGIGLLPLVGVIDTNRAKYILENTLMECSKQSISHLYIDISGVNVLDTMVAMQIFHLIDTLKITGVKTSLSGVRPEIALTAVHLGLDFKDIHITGNLSQALNFK